MGKFNRNIWVVSGNIGTDIVVTHDTEKGRMTTKFNFCHNLYQTNPDGSNKDPMWFSVSFSETIPPKGKDNYGIRLAAECQKGDRITLVGELGHFLGKEGKYVKHIDAKEWEHASRPSRSEQAVPAPQVQQTVQQPQMQQVVQHAVPQPQPVMQQPQQLAPAAQPVQYQQQGNYGPPPQQQEAVVF